MGRGPSLLHCLLAFSSLFETAIHFLRTRTLCDELGGDRLLASVPWDVLDAGWFDDGLRVQHRDGQWNLYNCLGCLEDRAGLDGELGVAHTSRASAR
jgi:hypothetical protein